MTWHVLLFVLCSGNGFYVSVPGVRLEIWHHALRYAGQIPLPPSMVSGPGAQGEWHPSWVGLLPSLRGTDLSFGWLLDHAASIRLCRPLISEVEGFRLKRN